MAVWSTSRLFGTRKEASQKGVCCHNVLTDRVSDWHFVVSHWQPKLTAIDEQPNDNVVHLYRLGKADCLARDS